MGEKFIAADKSTKYQGILDLKNLKNVINRWSKDNEYGIKTASSEEKIYHDGKEILYKASLGKEPADWIKIGMSLTLDFRKMEEVDIEMDEKKLTMWKGECNISVKTIIETDGENRFSGNVMSILRILTDKLINKDDIKQATDFAKKDTESLHSEIKSFLNLERWPSD